MAISKRTGFVTSAGVFFEQEHDAACEEFYNCFGENDVTDEIVKNSELALQLLNDIVKSAPKADRLDVV